MAEKSLFWSTNGTGDGTSGGYTAQEFYDFIRRLLITDQEASQGVLRGVLNELAVTGSGSPLSIASGAGIAHGFYYENSAALNLTVTTPVVGTTGGRVNLKVDWTAQTVRAVVQLNTDGTATIPSLVQTAGSEWNLPLYTFTVTTAGVITLTDVRSYCQFANYLTAAGFDAIPGLSVVGRAANSEGASGAITADADGEALLRNGNTLEFGQVQTAGLGSNVVTDGKLRQSAAMSVIGRAADSVGNVADITAGVDGYVLRRSGTSVAFGQIAAAGIANGAVTNAKLADDSVDDTKAGNRVPQFPRRQGGDSANWNTPGISNYTPTMVRMQGGMEDINLGVGISENTVAITFPVAFSNVPLIWVTMQLRSGMNPDTTTYTAFVDSVSASGVTLRIARSATTDGSVTPYIQWLAIGPE